MTWGSMLLFGLAALGCSSGPAGRLPDAPTSDDATADSAAFDAPARLCKQRNHALSFAGGQQVTIPASASLNPQDLAVEVWARFAGFPGAFQTIVARPFGGSTGDSFAIWHEGSRLAAGVNVTSTADAIGINLSPVIGRWYHFALAFDHTTRVEKLYVDGAMVAMATASAAEIAYDDGALLIGADVNHPAQLDFFQGDIDEVRLWKSARSDTMIAADMHECQSNDDLAGYWPFDEGSGAITADLSGNNNTATLGPTTAIEPADPSWITSDVPF